MYKIGDKFRVVNTKCGFKAGQIITLNGSYKTGQKGGTAVFAGKNETWSNAYNEGGSRIQGAWMDFKDIEFIIETPVVKETPASRLGYKVGDKFIVTRDHTFELDSIVTLHKDDGSKYPLFAGEGSYHRCVPNPDGGRQLRGAYEDLDFIKPYVEPVADPVIEQITEHYENVYRGLYMGSLGLAVKNLQDICYKASKDAGWWTDLKTGEAHDPVKLGPEKIALMHSELSEALEGLRKGQMDDKLPHRPMAEVELADCIIRALDWAGAMGYDVGGAIVEKIEFNANRPDHKIANRLKDDGKKF